MLLMNTIEIFLEYMSSIGRSEETISGYGKDLVHFTRFLDCKYNCESYIEEITVTDLEEYLHYLKEERGYAPASRLRNLHTLRSFFAYAYKKELVVRNIALSVEKIKVQQKERTYLTEDEVERLVHAIDHLLIRLVVIVLYMTGLRISECLNLTVDDVNLEDKVIHVVAGKGNKDRLIPISLRLLPLLQEYVQEKRPTTASPLFFCTKKTGMLSPVYVNKEIAEAVKRLGWKKKVTAHILRHSFASQLVKNDVNLVQIQKLLGHSSLNVTSIYTHTNLDQLSDAINTL
ncbi:phage integrase, N-terminal SAM-like domain protein [Brevibacillus laterosporus GI-9]|uniref:tyrosine-type recombinase/integrase n=1 Tax=Brevibacillus TaxID=55080 RepID=UPI00024054EE|nr:MULTISPECIES: tyrosine-type recombinase/integrase [Brevibacillus]MCR8963047.1 tyrosine-type recombinase/integrase [Brevibacillus laterosporus]MCZ0835203.1 tyrosine-type recombinase/integrase [Brevibacillus halotolerans]CCF17051.1 phage integrase, N-terminal SAM-like domain protein [Brevibacillus laterosporus GI-9]